MATEQDESLTSEERDQLARIRGARTLAALESVMDAPSEHAAYFRAKRTWRTLRNKELGPPPVGGFPGDDVDVGANRFVVHGITHADTDAERSFLRERVSEMLARGESVYCEQGIRPMYFSEMDAVYEMDDYQWAIERCQQLDIESHVPQSPTDFEGVGEDINSLATTFREATFSLIDSGSDVYGEEFTRVLGDIASDFLMTHEQQATGEDFAAFRITRTAAEDPEKLGELQHYYKRTFLPQPLEREWLRRHDPELELVTHARNERIADYAVAHCGENPTAGCTGETVHLIVGAAHQPGVVYYLEQFRDDERTLSGFELLG